MKKTFLKLLVAVIAFTAGLTLSHITGLFTRVESTPSVDVREVEAAQLAIPAPPPIPIPAATPKATVILDYDVESFHPELSYELSGKAPKGFKEFGSFSFYRNYNEESFGGVQLTTYSGGEYEAESQEAVFVLVTQKRLQFVTAPFTNGIQYRFDGQFIRGGELTDYAEGTSVLQGTLTKSRNGRTIIEATVKLKVIFDHC